MVKSSAFSNIECEGSRVGWKKGWWGLVGEVG